MLVQWGALNNHGSRRAICQFALCRTFGLANHQGKPIVNICLLSVARNCRWENYLKLT
jgi:hypothetical protein